MEKFDNSGKDAVISDDLIGRIAEKVARSDQLTKPISVLVRDQVNHHVQVRSGVKVSSGVKNASQPDRANMSRVHTDLGTRKRMRPTRSTADSSDTDEIHGDRPTHQIQ